MKYCKTIYKKDTKNKVRYLTVNMFDDKLQQISGIMNTSNPIIHEKICKPKNVGRSNETSGNEQAYKEAEALIKDKLTKGYFETIKEAETEDVILPMLAKNFKDESHKIDFDDIINCQLFVQPKLDGMRCLAHIDIIPGSLYSNSCSYKTVLKSRDGKIIQNMMHIEEDLNKLATRLNIEKFPHILDGELYVHGEDFQTNMEFIKKYRKGKTERIKYHIYDKINIGEVFNSRNLGLQFISGLSKGLKLNSLDFVPTYQIKSLGMLKTAHEGFLKCGYEGTMIRKGSGLYKVNGRSSDLLKYKDFLDIDCEIIDIIPCDVRSEWGKPILKWNGKTFSSGTKMSHEARIDLLTNKKDYIGKIANVRYFELSNTGIPRFPVTIGIHIDR